MRGNKLPVISWRWTGRPTVLQSRGSQIVRHDWATELKWSNSPKNFLFKPPTPPATPLSHTSSCLLPCLTFCFYTCSWLLLSPLLGHFQASLLRPVPTKPWPFLHWVSLRGELVGLKCASFLHRVNGYSLPHEYLKFRIKKLLLWNEFQFGWVHIWGKARLLVPQYYVMLNNYSALQAVLLCWSQRPESSYLKENGGTFLVIQWIKIRLPMQGTWVQSLVWEGGCHRGTKTTFHSYWRPCASSLCPETREAATVRSPRTTTRVAPPGRN